MISSLAISVAAVSCLGCAPPEEQVDSLRLDVGPVLNTDRFDGAALIQNSDPIFTPSQIPDGGSFPLRAGSRFAPNTLAQPESAARFKALDLSTPMALRVNPGDTLSAEFAFGASSAQTGLGLDLELAQRTQIETNRAGNNVARTGAEVRLGQNLMSRDQRGSNAAAPSWYFFVGSDNEALVWNLAGKQGVEGMALRDQVTVGDLQAGVAWSAMPGAQMSLGLVEREMSYTDKTGDYDVNMKEQFAAFSFTVRR